MLIASIVLVFGAVAVLVGNVVMSDQGQLGLGFEQMIHARIPWLLVAALLLGAGLGVASLVRARRGYKWAIVPVEVFFAVFLSWSISLSFLPEHRLALSVGDAFPSYSLVDQDGELHSVQSATGRSPTLFIFYRGDW